eukprot:jgi/Mesen1/6908/ME000354S06099
MAVAMSASGSLFGSVGWRRFLDQGPEGCAAPTSGRAAVSLCQSTPALSRHALRSRNMSVSAQATWRRFGLRTVNHLSTKKKGRSSLQATAGSSTVQEEGQMAEECELVLGREVQIGNAGSSFGGLLMEAVKNKNGAGVLLLTDIRGHENADTRDFAYRLACFGYSVLIPDLFQGEPFEGSPSSGPEFEEWRAQHTPERLEATINSAYAFLKSSLDGILEQAAASHADDGALEEDSQDSTQTPQEETGGLPGHGRVGLLGFCFGGGQAVQALARDEEGRFSTGVIFYGTRFDSALGDRIRVPTLLIVGDQDPLCKVGEVRELAKRIKSSSLKVYKGRGHAFAHHPASIDDDEDAEDAFEVMRKWVHDHLLEATPGLWASDM